MAKIEKDAAWRLFSLYKINNFKNGVGAPVPLINSRLNLKDSR